MTPLGRGLQRLMMRRARAVLAREQPEPLIQPPGQLVERQRPQPHCCQLDRKRDPVEAVAQPQHVRPVRVGDGETGHRRGCPQAEQRDRVVRGQRGNRAHVLARYVQWLPAGSQYRHRGCAAQQHVGEHRAGIEQVLAGIQDQQQLAVTQVIQGRVELRASVGLRQPQAAGDGVGQQLRVTQAGQLNQAHTVREAPGHRAGGAQRDPGFPDPAGPGQRDQPRGPEQAGQHGQLGIPADERGDFHREFAGATLAGPS